MIRLLDQHFTIGPSRYCRYSSKKPAVSLLDRRHEPTQPRARYAALHRCAHRKTCGNGLDGLIIGQFCAALSKDLAVARAGWNGWALRCAKPPTSRKVSDARPSTCWISAKPRAPTPHFGKNWPFWAALI